MVNWMASKKAALLRWASCWVGRLAAMLAAMEDSPINKETYSAVMSSSQKQRGSGMAVRLAY